MMLNSGGGDVAGANGNSLILKPARVVAVWDDGVVTKIPKCHHLEW